MTKKEYNSLFTVEPGDSPQDILGKILMAQRIVSDETISLLDYVNNIPISSLPEDVQTLNTTVKTLHTRVATLEEVGSKVTATTASLDRLSTELHNRPGHYSFITVDNSSNYHKPIGLWDKFLYWCAGIFFVLTVSFGIAFFVNRPRSLAAKFMELAETSGYVITKDTHDVIYIFGKPGNGTTDQQKAYHRSWRRALKKSVRKRKITPEVQSLCYGDGTHLVMKKE